MIGPLTVAQLRTLAKMARGGQLWLAREGLDVRCTWGREGPPVSTQMVGLLMGWGLVQSKGLGQDAGPRPPERVGLTSRGMVVGNAYARLMQALQELE